MSCFKLKSVVLFLKILISLVLSRNVELRKQAKSDFEKDFFQLMNNFVFGITMENVREHRDNKLITTNKKRNQLVSEPNYHTLKYFLGKLISNRNEKDKSKNE